MPNRRRSGLSVLMTADAVGGVWTYALELARNLSHSGVQVFLATMGPLPSPEQRRDALEIKDLCLFESSYALEWMDDPWDDVERAGDWLLDLERSLSPDVVHLNGYCHGALPWRAPTLMIGHSCVLSWWEAVKGESAPGRYSRYQKEVSRGIKAAHRLAAPTGAMLRALERHYGPHPRAQVIPNGHEAPSFAAVPKEPFVFCATRAWDEAKNVSALAKAAEKLSWPVYIAGDASDPKTGAPMQFDHAKLLGRLERTSVLGWLARASVFALPARYEPFGLSALEAACAGCALVLGDIPSLREIWGDAAVYVPPNDPAALREAIEGLIHDPVRRQGLADRARGRGLQLSAGRMASHYANAYIELADARAPAVSRTQHQRSFGRTIP
ncbi:glycosyltransferase family 4 protein [Polyangium aurulentum]|uniref:glycosyltransferase family 4 protein n=1 Tax=Polyangium aurulentum TaxID=2567896 RepID=UPI001F464769|nr:glycosyltransferase family 4 protein [Polyangium aurulentum]